MPRSRPVTGRGHAGVLGEAWTVATGRRSRVRREPAGTAKGSSGRAASRSVRHHRASCARGDTASERGGSQRAHRPSKTAARRRSTEKGLERARGRSNRGQRRAALEARWPRSGDTVSNDAALQRRLESVQTSGETRRKYNERRRRPHATQPVLSSFALPSPHDAQNPVSYRSTPGLGTEKFET